MITLQEDRAWTTRRRNKTKTYWLIVFSVYTKVKLQYIESEIVSTRLANKRQTQ